MKACVTYSWATEPGVIVGMFAMSSKLCYV